MRKDYSGFLVDLMESPALKDVVRKLSVQSLNVNKDAEKALEFAKAKEKGENGKAENALDCCSDL